MKISIVVLLTLALFASISIQQGPTKPTWPTEFQIPFGLNWGVALHNASAMMYYNYDQAESQLLDYYTHCFPLVRYNSLEHPCKMWFNPKGIFVAIPSLNIPCCLFVEGVGAVPPTFLQGFSYSGVNTTENDLYGNAHQTYQWNGADDFKYWTDISSGDDIKFQDGPTGVTWSFGEMDVTPQNVTLFNLPSGNCSAKCDFLDLETFLAKHEMAIPFYRI